MLRWLLKIVFLLILAGLAYGLFLLYQEKTPEEKKELRSSVRNKARQAGRLVERAGAKTIEKGREIYRDSRRKDQD